MSDLEEQLDSIELDIRDVLDKIADDSNSPALKGKDKAWTGRIKNDLARLGKDLKFSVYASSCPEANGGEWLFDLCWLQMLNNKHLGRGSRKHVRSAPLILECEWDMNGLMDDFPKLVMGRAEHRVMIYQAKKEEDKDCCMKEFLLQIRNSQSTVRGDRYLFACWDIGKKKFHYDHHIA